MTQELKVATSQFPATADVSKNLLATEKQIKFAAKNGADVIHFCECSLSSYAGIDFEDFSDEANKKI
jgi:predicted amidohydrolase